MTDRVPSACGSAVSLRTPLDHMDRSPQGEGASARGAGVGCEGALGGIRIASGVCDAGLRRGDHVARCVLPERTGACSPTWRGDGGRTSMTRELDSI